MKKFTFTDLVNMKIQNKEFHAPPGTLSSKIEAIQYIKQIKKMSYQGKKVDLETLAKLHRIEQESILDFLTSATTKD
jgi:hypothetical protein